MTRIVKGLCFARETHAPRSSAAIKPSATGARRVIFGSQIFRFREIRSAEGKRGDNRGCYTCNDWRCFKIFIDAFLKHFTASTAKVKKSACIDK